MSIKSFTLGTAIALVAMAAVPSTSEAKADPSTAIDACVKSFVQSYLPDRKVRQVAKATPSSGPLAVFWSPREYTVVLKAHGASSGELIAEARCVANRNGIVVVLDSPLLAKDLRTADFVVSIR